MSAPVSRARCPRCHRPSLHCLCSELVPIRPRTHVSILQHPAERDHALGTVPLLRSALPEAKVCALDLDADGIARPQALPSGAVILFPDPNAPLLAEVDPPPAIVLLDGTWSQARKQVRRAPWLARLPRARIVPPRPQRYDVRGEPGPEHASTLEAAVEALRILEPNLSGLDALIGAFDTMVAREQQRRRAPNPRRRASPRSSPRAPGSERRPLDVARLVVADAETVATDAGPRLLRWTAVRLDDHAVFDAVVRHPSGTVPAAKLAHAAIPERLWLNAQPLAEVRTRWDQFCSDRRVATWTGATWKVAPSTLHAPLALKGAFADRSGIRAGSVDDAFRSAGLGPVRPSVAGRIGDRLARTVALTQHLGRPGDD